MRPHDDDDIDTDVTEFIEAMDRALTVHEAGHAVVAHKLGAHVVFVEIDLQTGNGGSRSSDFADQVKNLAVCVAGCRAEHLLGARSLRKTKKADFRLMRTMLSRLPQAERRIARARGYQLADCTLRANAHLVRKIADELMGRRWSAEDTVVRIERDELITLLESIDMKREWLRGLADWADNNGSVNEVWLFGSRADGTSTADSDVDIGLGLAPPIGNHDWALGNFYALHTQWRRELEVFVGRDVSLEPITPEKHGTAVVPKWVLLWRRETHSAMAKASGATT